MARFTQFSFLILASCWGAADAIRAGDSKEFYENEIVPILETYCFDCHADGIKKGDFSMDRFEDLEQHLGDKKHWMPVWNNLRSQIMPPSDEEQPSTEEKRKLVSWIEREVFKLDPAKPDPGRVTIRRLNRNEYKNAVFDLLGVELDTMDSFPADDTGYGFDNIGAVLSISPLLMEKYVAAADEVVAMALPDGADAQFPRVEIPGASFKSPSNSEVNASWLPFANHHEVKVDQEVSWDGEYQVAVEYSIHGATEATTDEAVLRVTAGGIHVGEVALGWDQRPLIKMEGRVALKKGAQSFQVNLVSGKRPRAGEEDLFFKLERVVLTGPLDGVQKEVGKGYRMIFMDGPPPEEPAACERYARKILRSFVSRAFRKPVDEQTIDRLIGIVDEVDREPGKNFQDGIRQALSTCLASPRFLFRVELQAEPNNPAKVVLLDEYSLASRLSFFLWNSVPDDELLSLALKNQLRENLSAQVDRMLADWRSRRFIESFVGQWLQARDVSNVQVNAKSILGLKTDSEASKVFTWRLRADMRQETEMLFEFILREGRPVEELISARYSFLNERLAKFYGIDGVVGDQFREVDLTEHPERGGLLTQGTFLTVTSNPTRTSPVKRGLFVLDNLLGTPPPHAPPNIPALEDVGQAVQNPTMREMMEIHRAKPDCRGCHARMDPIGLGLENFNALGQFRIEENGKPIDTSGKLVTGEKFQSVAELKELLSNNRRKDLYRCISEKLLTYAIGRGMEYYDSTTINQLCERMEKNHGKLRELIQGIVECAPFQQRRGDD